MDALLIRRMMMMAGGTPPTPPGPTINYLVFGNPTINGTSYIPDQSTNGFIYTDKPFDPGAGKSWIIQVKIRINTAKAWRDIISSVNEADGTMAYSIVSQTHSSNSNRQYGLYLSSNGTSWNVANNQCKGNLYPGTWYKFQIVCTYSSSKYNFKQGFPDSGNWTNTYSTSTKPLYGKYISFGRNMIDAKYDLSETKIWVDGQLWWEAITSNT